MSSRVAKDEVRKVKLFQKNLYATIDLYLGLTEVYKIVCDPKDDPDALMTVPFEYNGAKQFIAYDKPVMSEQDALRMELQNFIKSFLRDLSHSYPLFRETKAFKTCWYC